MCGERGERGQGGGTGEGGGDAQIVRDRALELWPGLVAVKVKPTASVLTARPRRKLEDTIDTIRSTRSVLAFRFAVGTEPAGACRSTPPRTRHPTGDVHIPTSDPSTARSTNGCIFKRAQAERRPERGDGIGAGMRLLTVTLGCGFLRLTASVEPNGVAGWVGSCVTANDDAHAHAPRPAASNKNAKTPNGNRNRNS